MKKMSEEAEAIEKLFKEEWLDLGFTIIQHIKDCPNTSKQYIYLNINDLIRDFADFEKLKAIGADERYILQRKILKEMYDSFYSRVNQFLFLILSKNHKDQEYMKNYKELHRMLNEYPFYRKMFILSTVVGVDPFDDITR